MKTKLLSLLALALCWAGSMRADYSGNGTGKSDDPYQITSADQLVEFATIVNGGQYGAYAELTTDITLTSEWTTPIGNTTTSSKAYTGTFNGNNHAITGFNHTATANRNGLFGYVKGATIKDFSISGTLTCSNGKTGAGVVGWSEGSSISGIHSSLTIYANTDDGVFHHVGGIVGSARPNSKVGTTVERCHFSGTMTVNSSSLDCFGGIVGYTNDYCKFTDCINSGTITFSKSDGFVGGIVGYINNANCYGAHNCLNVGNIVYAGEGTPDYGGAIVGRLATHSADNIGTNYWKTGSAAVTGRGNGQNSLEAKTIEVNTDQLESGEICYLLNGNQSTDVIWYQTIPNGDAYPLLDSSHGIVYVSGTVCPNTGTPQGTYLYSNTNATNTGSHIYSGYGICTNCDYVNPSFTTEDAEGYFELNNKNKLVWFAAWVNYGNYNAKARLTADIDMTGADISHFPIGSPSDASKRFTGTFDGQKHKISNFQLVNSSAPTNYGMFNTGSGVTLKDFWLDSTCKIQGTEIVGLIGCHTTGGATISGVGNCGDVQGTNNNVGGLIGSIRLSKNNATVTIENCWTTGNVVTTNTEATNYTDCGALCGWINYVTVNINNCWTTAKVTYTNSYSKYVYRAGGDVTITVTNCYSMYGSQNNFSTITDAQVESGELCYKLNSDQSNITWYQTLGTGGDDYPTLSSSSEQVLYVGAAGYSTFYDAENDWALLGDAQAYIGTINASNNLHLEGIDDIPANTAVVIGGTYYNKVSATANATTTGNVLIGSTGYEVPADKAIYALAQKGDPTVVGFYPVAEGVNIPAGKAYLDMTGLLVKAFLAFDFDDDATSINEELRAKNEASEGDIYNLAGQIVNGKSVNGKLPKGIYIVNGKKVLR